MLIDYSADAFLRLLNIACVSLAIAMGLWLWVAYNSVVGPPSEVSTERRSFLIAGFCLALVVLFGLAAAFPLAIVVIVLLVLAFG